MLSLSAAKARTATGKPRANQTVRFIERYSHVRRADIQANVPIEGEEKHLREFEDDGMAIELAAPFRPHARPDEFSRLRIRVHGEKVFEIRWDKAGGFEVVHFDRGDWERTLRSWPAPARLTGAFQCTLAPELHFKRQCLGII
jgi:hypothetical protein